ncbi:12K-protein [Plantago asiatica mosaic virus]|uniref:Movement protein TGB2 n=1 Tax=Plantago asiatica mosaic potexvirus TaxID=28354 RepID=TGB2_P1AMV|nr:12K triple gene block protein [Plantago asiatica mosaic virus]Q07519.1 RecName: Full=Movement protein TGB2; AltName: Full=12 kDa protein; AltName: Full=Triple gene block 2 protein; Short=TGBp2 [Plantago asiatica mosaic virus]AAB26349.1 12 kda putative membrane-associated protein [Plantago asiatica mosaic virus]CAA79763.1 12K-protein [Plantago asiatica mosaic virus]
MSGAHHLTPPTDYGKPVLAASIGISLALLVYTATRSTLPHVGDNLHALPHGGRYVDGTKSISYFSPSASKTRDPFPFAFLLILTLSGLILLLSRRRSNPHSCPSCGTPHA